MSTPTALSWENQLKQFESRRMIVKDRDSNIDKISSSKRI